jgi:hypothetical protein
VKESSIKMDQSLMPYQQTAEITQPSEYAFNFPALSVTSEFSAVLFLW